MNKNLFCFQCEQTDRTGLLQDALTGALIGLARASESSADLLTPETDALIQRSLSACADSSPDDAEIQALLDQGATVVVIEHDLDVIRNSDYVIDMGPGGGDSGGRIVACGTPEDIRKDPASVTGRYL